MLNHADTTLFLVLEARTSAAEMLWKSLSVLIPVFRTDC